MICKISRAAWSVIKTAIPASANSRITTCTPWTVTGSIPAKGSSSIMIFGLATKQRAISKRRISPPDSLPALDLRIWPILNCSSNSSVRTFCCLRLNPSNCIMPFRLSCTDSFENTLDFCGKYAIPPSRLRRCNGQLVTSIPCKKTDPRSGVTNPHIILKDVDLPAPLGPSKPTISPARTSNETPSTTRRRL